MNAGGDMVEVLLVEDTPADAELTLRALEMRGLGKRVTWLKDGAEALDFLFGTGAYLGRDVVNHKPKVVLLDLRLPKISGLDVLRQVKADPRTQSIPIVVVTSSREEVDLEECYRMGANSYITKPVEFDEFAQAVGELGRYWLMVNRRPEH